MAGNIYDPYGDTYTIDASVDYPEATNDHNTLVSFSNDIPALTGSYSAPHHDDLQTNWYTDDVIGAEDDLFGQYIHSSPKTPGIPRLQGLAASKKPAKASFTARAKSVSVYFDPRPLLADPSEANIDPQLRSQPTDSPQSFDPTSGIESSTNQLVDTSTWNVPPIGHSYWKTFTFKAYMDAIGPWIDSGKGIPGPVAMVPGAKMYEATSDLGSWDKVYPTQFNNQPFGNPASFSNNADFYGFQHTYQDQAQHAPSRYVEPNYYAAVPAYSLLPENSVQPFGNMQQSHSFLQNQQQDNILLSIPHTAFSNLNQMPFDGPTGVETYLPSADSSAGGNTTKGFGTDLPANRPDKADVASEETSPSARPATWNAAPSDSENARAPYKREKATMDESGKKKNARSKRSKEAALKAQDVYEQRPRPPNLTVYDGKKEYDFKYNRFGELESMHTPEALRAYILNKYSRTHRGSSCVLIQCVPADSSKRYPTLGTSDKCRFTNCIAKSRTIAQGTFRVALDEEVNAKKYDPYHTAGFVHLYCLERFLDLKEIARTCKIAPDDRILNKDVEGGVYPSRINLNRTSSNNEKTANDYLQSLRDGSKRITGRSGDGAWDYSNTLCWKLTRNATIDAKPPRTANAQYRGGVNMFVHFNDEEKRVEYTEMRDQMDKENFERTMHGKFQDMMGAVHPRFGSVAASRKSSTLAQRREKKKTYELKKRKKPMQLATPLAATFPEFEVRHSSRLSKPSTPVSSQGETRSPRSNNRSSFPMPSPIQTSQGRKRSHEPDPDTEGEDDSPKTVRPRKKSKPTGPSTPLLPLQQEKLNSRASPALNFALSPSPKTPVTARRISSLLSPPPMTPITPIRLTSLQAQLKAEFADGGENSLLSSSSTTPVPHSPWGANISRQGSDAFLFEASDTESPTSRSGRPIKKVTYTR